MHFWHIPWPPWEIYRVCPWRQELLEGLLGNDLLGFHLEQHCRNFLECAERALAEALQYDLETIPGAWVEDKGLTLTVHMREVPAPYVPLVQRLVLRLLRPALEARVFALRTGKAVVEVRPAVTWDKGEAVRWIVDHMRQGRPATDVFPVYIGDDETDEDAFQALGATGLGILVGSDCAYSAAHYCVESVEQTSQFLAVLSGLVWPIERNGARETPP